MRFESRHRPIKAIVQSTSCKKNLLYTIGVKESLNICKIVHSAKYEKINMDQSRENKCKIENNKKDNDFFNNLSSVTINGIFYKLDMFIVIKIKSTLNTFGKITKITKKKSKTFLTVDIYNEIYFDGHYHSYVVERCFKDISINMKSLLMAEPAYSIIRNVNTCDKKPNVKHFLCLQSGL